LIEGWAYQHQILTDGRRQILDFSLPGALLGIQARPAAAMSHAAESLTGVTVAALPRWWLCEIFDREPNFAMLVLSSTVNALDLAYDSITDVGRRNAYESVAHLMLTLFTRVRAQCPGTSSDSVALPLTQLLIADALGLTYAHVCRTLATLRGDGVLKLRDGTLTILDFDRLGEIVGDWPEAAVSPWRDIVAGKSAEGVRSLA
jgi:CRP-like cAMP-binding protein